MPTIFHMQMRDEMFRDALRYDIFSISEANDSWSNTEQLAVTNMSVNETCLYDLYIRVTKEVTIITSLFNAAFATSHTVGEVDKMLVPIRALVLIKYKYEEVKAVLMEDTAWDSGLPFDVNEVYYWRYMVDSQVNEACLPRLFPAWLAVPDAAYASDFSGSSDDEEGDHHSSDSSASEEDTDRDEDEREKELKDTAPVNPVTGRGDRSRFNLRPTSRPRDPTDRNISAKVAMDPSLRAALLKRFGKRGRNAILEDRGEDVRAILKKRMNDHYKLWRCSTAITRFLGKNGNIKLLRRESYDFAALMDEVPEREWHASREFTEKQVKEDLCIVVETVHGERHFYRAERDVLNGSFIRISQPHTSDASSTEKRIWAIIEILDQLSLSLYEDAQDGYIGPRAMTKRGFWLEGYGLRKCFPR